MSAYENAEKIKFVSLFKLKEVWFCKAIQRIPLRVLQRYLKKHFFARNMAILIMIVQIFLVVSKFVISTFRKNFLIAPVAVMDLIITIFGLISTIFLWKIPIMVFIFATIFITFAYVAILVLQVALNPDDYGVFYIYVPIWVDILFNFPVLVAVCYLSPVLWNSDSQPPNRQPESRPILQENPQPVSNNLPRGRANEIREADSLNDQPNDRLVSPVNQSRVAPRLQSPENRENSRLAEEIREQREEGKEREEEKEDGLENLEKQNSYPVIVDDETKRECVICLNKPPIYSCVPCGHLCLCEDCITKLKEKMCPICRRDFSMTLRIY